MNINITGLHIEVTEAIRNFIEKKVDKLSKFFEPDTLVHVTFSARKERQNIDIRIEYKSKTYLAEVETDDIYYGIENCVEKIEGQVRKEKDKHEKDRHEAMNAKVIADEEIEE